MFPNERYITLSIKKLSHRCKMSITFHHLKVVFPNDHHISSSVCFLFEGEAQTDHTNRKPYLSRYKNWGDEPCHGKYVHNICILSTGDLPVLAESKFFFANKFHLDYQPRALDCLEELLFNRTRDEYLGNLVFVSRWYGQLGFVKDKIWLVQ